MRLFKHAIAVRALVRSQGCVQPPKEVLMQHWELNCTCLLTVSEMWCDGVNMGLDRIAFPGSYVVEL